MKFVIRDDDTNFFTQPQELEAAYGSLWGRVPISLAVVPFIAGSYFAVRENEDKLPTKQDKLNYIKNLSRNRPIKIESIRRSICLDDTFEIGGNTALVAFLRRSIDLGAVCLLLHGFNHHFFPEGYEFEFGTDLDNKVAIGKEYLEDVFGVKIKTFVAPNNTISTAGIRAVLANSLNILGGSAPFILNISTPIACHSFVKRVLFKLRYGRKAKNPFIKNFGGFKLFGCNRLGYNTTFEQLKNTVDFAAKLNGNFCVETHYYALCRSEQMRSVLNKLIEYVEERYGTQVRFVTGNELFEK